MSLFNTKASTGKQNMGDAKSNFGTKGWLLIALCGFMLYFSTGTSVDGLNVTVGALAEKHGWEPAVLLGFSTLSGLVSIVGMFIFGLICHKIGARRTAIISLVLGGLSYIWYGHAGSVAQYAVALCLVSLFSNVYAWIAGGAYLSMWFPKKKGLALGWATMGNNMASATIVILITSLINWLGGIEWAITAIGISMILLTVWAWVTPDKPEDAGYYPDNNPNGAKKTQTEEGKAYVSKWTYGRLMKTKQFWFISIGLGLYMMVTVGVMSQLVPRLVGIGFSLEKAIGTMTVCAVVGIVGSYLWGVIDQIFTTRIATALYGVWYGVAVLLNLIPDIATIYISIFMIGIAIGGNANWPVSLVTSVYGSKDFAKVYSLINPAISVIRMLSFVVLAVSLSLTGAYTAAYILFVALCLAAAFMILIIDDKEYAEE